MREALAAVLVALAVVAAGCENPDFRGVRFKPLVRDPDAFRTALKGYVFTSRPVAPAWAGEFLFHQRAPAERDLSAVAGARLVLDEATVLVTDAAGLYGADGQAPGFHSLKLEAGRRIHPGILKLEKDHVTLVCLVIESDGGVTQVDTVVAHTFITAPIFRQLLGFKHTAGALVRRYARARSQGDARELAQLLADDYADSEGGRTDLMRALRVKGQMRRPMEVVSFAATLTGGGTSGVVVAKVRSEETIDFHRLELKADATSVWRIAAIAE